jgi:hypothetical protein
MIPLSLNDCWVIFIMSCVGTFYCVGYVFLSEAFNPEYNA